MTEIIIPNWPKYSDYRELKPPHDPAALGDLCSHILEQHGPAVDQLHADVRESLEGEHATRRMWACKKVRIFLTTTGREQVLHDYFQQLEEAKQAAKALPFVEFMPDHVQMALEIQVDLNMSYELRVQLRNALVAVQHWDNQLETAPDSAKRRVSKPGSAAKRHSKRRQLHV